MRVKTEVVRQSRDEVGGSLLTGLRHIDGETSIWALIWNVGTSFEKDSHIRLP